MPVAFTYSLSDILPELPDPGNSDDEASNRNKARKSGKKAIKTDNSIIMDGPISKFINKHHNLVKRYLVLN